MKSTGNFLGAAVAKLGGGFLAAPKEHAGHCPKHGAYAARQFISRITPACPHCLQAQMLEASLAQQKADRKISEQRRAEQDRKDLCESTDIPPRFADKTVKSWLPESESEKANLRGVVGYAKHLQEGGCGALVLHGHPGTGKTHLACALLGMVKRDLGGNVQYLTAGAFARQARESINFKSKLNESGLLAFYENFDLLVVDEVGNQMGGDKEQVLLCELLNRRYAKMKPTIVVSNLGQAELKKFVGEVAWERLLDGGVHLAFDGRSRRQALQWEGGE